MRIVWSPRAVRHLTALRDHIAADNPGAAAAVAVSILDSVDRLVSQPYSGRTGRLTGTRELRGERLELIAVFHGKQRWPKRV